LGMVLSRDGLPITYDVFPGNTFEGKTVVGMIDKLREEYDINKVIFVGDRGLVSDEVLSKLEGLNCGYVIAARLKNLSKEVKDEIASEEGWEKLTEDLKVKELDVNDRRLVVYKSRELEEEHRRVRMDILDEMRITAKVSTCFHEIPHLEQQPGFGIFL
jgi:transposase